MVKRSILCLFAIVVVWIAADVLLHNVFLAPYYGQNPALWRPVAQMNVALIMVVRFALAAILVAIYALQVRPKSVRAGLIFGLLTGLLLGVAVGPGTYIHSPISLVLLWGWFVGAVAKGLLAGALLGWMVRE